MKLQKLNSIPVRVTTSTAHIWLNKAVCGLFFLPIFRLVRYLSANRMLAQFAQRRRMDAPQLRRTGAIRKIVLRNELKRPFSAYPKNQTLRPLLRLHEPARSGTDDSIRSKSLSSCYALTLPIRWSHQAPPKSARKPRNA